MAAEMAARTAAVKAASMVALLAGYLVVTMAS